MDKKLIFIILMSYLRASGTICVIIFRWRVVL